jgi:hypothetical protein
VVLELEPVAQVPEEPALVRVLVQTVVALQVQAVLAQEQERAALVELEQEQVVQELVVLAQVQELVVVDLVAALAAVEQVLALVVVGQVVVLLVLELGQELVAVPEQDLEVVQELLQDHSVI